MRDFLILEPSKMEKTEVEPTKREFLYRFANGQRFISIGRVMGREKFHAISIDASDLLTPSEVEDVMVSWKEIQEGSAKKFKNAKDFLKELKTP
jgi:hypothetical protein